MSTARYIRTLLRRIGGVALSGLFAGCSAYCGLQLSDAIVRRNVESMSAFALLLTASVLSLLLSLEDLRGR